METKTISLNADAILRKKFTPNVKGYDPEEVDAFLDAVINDYREFEEYFKESKGYIVDLENQLRRAKESNNSLTIEKAKLEARLAGVKDSSDVNSSNLKYINRISKLEKALWEADIDPENIK